MVLLFVPPTQPEEGKSLQIQAVRKISSGFAFPTNSSANRPEPGPVLSSQESAANKSPPHWHFGSPTRTTILKAATSCPD